MNTYPTFEELTTLLRSLRPFLLDPTSAGEVILKHRNDFVTAADVGVQKRLRQALAERYPHIRFMGEEDADHTVDPDVPTFILDPIDGTTNYIFSYGLSAVSLALVHRHRAELGAIYNPYTDELFLAERGKGAFLNGSPIRVVEATAPGEALAAIGTSSYYKEHVDSLMAITRRLYLDCIDIRRSGSAATDLAYTANGRVGLYAERKLQLWDYAAGAVILEEAGGKITDWAGKPLPMTGEADIAASNGALHPYLLSVLKEYT
ncbi:MAG: inositol monophosphatase [Clostridia bacterium]|nr:inositol monophosphatase [Clostridia bacterium]